MASIFALATLLLGLLALVFPLLKWLESRKEWRQPPVITNADGSLPLVFRGQGTYSAALLVINKVPGLIAVGRGTSIKICRANPIPIRTPNDKITQQKEEGEYPLRDDPSFEVDRGQKSHTLVVPPGSLQAKMTICTALNTYFGAGACEGVLEFRFASARHRGTTAVPVRFGLL